MCHTKGVGISELPCEGEYKILNEDVVKEVLGSMEHCEEIGSIVFQMPEDEDMVATIIIGLEKQVPNKPSKSRHIGINGDFYDLCPNCDINLCTTGLFANKKMNYCEHCGQKLNWN